MIVRLVLVVLLLSLLLALQAASLIVPSVLLLAAAGVRALHDGALQLLAGVAPAALATAVVASVLLGSVAALALWRLRFWGLAAGLLVSPILFPVALLARGGSTESLVALFAGHASLGVAFGALCGLVCLIGVDGGMLRAAACCGVSPIDAIRRVLLPLMVPGIAAGAVLSAAASVCLSAVSQLQGTPAEFKTLLHQPAPIWLAAGGFALVLCAVASVALVLLRRR